MKVNVSRIESRAFHVLYCSKLVNVWIQLNDRFIAAQANSLRTLAREEVVLLADGTLLAKALSVDVHLKK